MIADEKAVRKMPQLTSIDKKARRVAAFQLFVQQYGRPKRRGGLDANDRRHDRGLQQRIKRMRPAELSDALLGDEDEAAG